MKTFMAKDATRAEAKWYIVDATDVVLGRLASQVANVLRGKHKPTFTPNADTGDYVIVINADKVKLTGNKLEDKMYTYHTGYVGGLKQIPYKTMMENKSDVVVYEAVKGMIPHNALGRKVIQKLRIYKGADHGHAAQKPEVLKIEG
ncbi:MAG: 50S ribosomal protein L13 [Clostridia bacterium]|nr:50S ribosomal protein L13 [Clostridia bacterium]